MNRVMNEAGGAACGPLAVATGNGLAPRPSCRTASSSRRPCRLSLREERGESGTFPVEGTQGIGILPFGNAVYWRGEQTPSQLQVLPRTPCRRPAGTQRTPQISADTPQIPDRDLRTPCGHPTETPQRPADTPQMTCRRPTETRRHPADDSQAPRGRRGCSCRQPSGRPSRATQGDGLCRPLLSLPDQRGKRVRQTTWCLNKV